MKLEFQKVIEPLYLAEYHPAYDGMMIDVWVNPPPQDITHLAKAVMKDVSNEDYETACQQIVTIWSQSEDPTHHWTVEEFKEKVIEGKQKDPMLMIWMVLNTITKITDYRTLLKKNSKSP